MSITRGDFLRSLGKSLPGLVASTGVMTAAQALINRVSAAGGGVAKEVSKAPPDAHIPFFEHGSGDGKQIALTFDDGPTPGSTDPILDILKSRGLLATFFMIGKCVVDAPDLARRVLAEGHEIGNHTFTHPKLAELSEEDAAAEVEKTENVFSATLGYKSAWLRAPYGSFRQNQTPLATARGLRVVTWSVDSGDWGLKDPAQISRNILTRTKPQSIILCHDWSPTVTCLSEVVDHLLEEGFSFLTLSALADIPEKPSV